MTNKEIFDHIFSLPKLDIEMHEYSSDTTYQKVEFSWCDGEMSAHGEASLHDDVLEFVICYQIDSLLYDIEHVRENGEECIGVNGPGEDDSYTYFKNGKPDRVEISKRTGPKWILKMNGPHPFMTMGRQDNVVKLAGQ